MAGESAAERVFAEPALCEQILLSLNLADRRAIGLAACACWDLALGARSALTKLQKRELPHVGGGGCSFVGPFAAAAAACVLGRECTWALSTLTFVLQLRRGDGRLLFSAAARPLLRNAYPPNWPDLREDVEFSGAFAPGVAPSAAHFEKTDTATLFAQRTSARGAAHIACIFSDLPRQRIERPILEDCRGQEDAVDKDASDFGSHTSDEEDESSEFMPSFAMRRQPEVTRFKPHTLFFVSPQDALPLLFETPGEADFENAYFRDETWCTLQCAIGSDDDSGGAGKPAAPTVRACLRFRTGPKLDEHRLYSDHSDKGVLLDMTQLTQVFAPLAWIPCPLTAGVASTTPA